jgi:hypothetical protein
MLWYAEAFQCAATPLRANDTSGRRDDAGSHRLTAIEDLAANPFRRDAKGRESHLHFRHEGIRATEVNVRVLREARRFKGLSRESAGDVEVFA